MLSAVIFDFDGIIVDSEPMHFRAFNEVLEPIHLSMSWEAYCDTYIGFDDRDAFRAVFAENGKDPSPDEIKRLIGQKAEVFQRCIQQGDVTPLPGAVELIKSLPPRLPVALCSGALRQDILPIISTLGIADAFTVIVTAEDTSRSKPDPAPYRLATGKLGTDNPASVVAIEDTPAGILSAKGAGLKVLAVTNSYDRNYLQEADSITDSLENVSPAKLEDMIA